jgi:hypothetical protein
MAWLKNPNGTAFQPQLASDRLSEGTHGRLCAGVGRHQRQAVEGHGRTHVHDCSPPTIAHMRKRHPRAIDRAVIGDVGHALKLPFRNVFQAPIDTIPGAIDPRIDRAQNGRDRVGRFGEGFALGYISLGSGHPGPGGLRVQAACCKSLRTPRNQPYPPPASRKENGRTSADAGRSAGDDDHARSHIFQ